MLVCQCQGVSDRAIRRAVREGAVTTDQVGRDCGAGTFCGGCRDTIHDIIHSEAASRESASPIVQLAVVSS